MNKHNPMCDNFYCTNKTGEVRVLPLGGSANAILCRSCFEHEMRYHKDRGLETKAPENWPIVKWEDLRIYGEDSEEAEQIL